MMLQTRMHSSGMRTVRSSSRLSRGVSASVHAGIPAPQEQTLPNPGADTPREQTLPDQTPPPLETCCKACWDSTHPPQRPAARHAGIPPARHARIPPPLPWTVDRHTSVKT